jgi:hypothetical protein
MGLILHKRPGESQWRSLPFCLLPCEAIAIRRHFRRDQALLDTEPADNLILNFSASREKCFSPIHKLPKFRNFVEESHILFHGHHETGWELGVGVQT